MEKLVAFNTNPAAPPLANINDNRDKFTILFSIETFDCDCVLHNTANGIYTEWIT